LSLHQFLVDHRSEILAESERRTLALAALRPSSDQLRAGLPLFLDQLIAIFSRPLINASEEHDISECAGEHGKELWRLGYTLTHVVHSYGAMCQAITEIASQTKASVTALEFHHLNRCLDIAIAAAVTEFESVRHICNKNLEVIHIGSVVHELRNALNRAQISFEMLSKGLVGLGGSTSLVLARSLTEMDGLISRSMSEVRLRADSELNEEFFLIIDVVRQLTVTAEIEAAHKQQVLLIKVDPSIGVRTDKNLVSAAIGNLIQNAMKFSKNQGVIQICAQSEKAFVIIEIRDQCGGIPENKLNSLFQPFVKQHSDKSGLGLGLTISKDAIEKCRGTMTVRNSNDGCVFTIRLPIYAHTTGVPQKPVI
jgi:signal transduction histidine kinase